MGRFADAVLTLLQPSALSRVKALESQLRQQLNEFADMQEQFSMLLAREAKRRTRAAQQALAAEPKPQQPDESPTDRKAVLMRRARAMGLGLKLPAPAVEELPEPIDEAANQ